MAARIDCFIDVGSPFSHLAFEYLRQHRDTLTAYGVDLEFHPVFLGAIMQASGNRPPLSVPAKGRYTERDRRRNAARLGLPQLSIPPFFPVNSLLPQRCLAHVKRTHPNERYEAAFRSLFLHVYERHRDVGQRDVLAAALRETFDAAEAQRALASADAPETKQALRDATQRALDLGAFGAPWFWVRNAAGKEEPFFGSDRFHYMFDFLDIPSQIGSVESARL